MTRPDADELVRRLILRRYREEAQRRRRLYKRALNRHLDACPDVDVHDPNSEPRSCGAGTCEMVEFTATLRCSHGVSIDYQWETVGDVAGCLDDLLADEERERNPPAPYREPPIAEYVRVPRKPRNGE